MLNMKLSKAFTLLEPGPVVLVTTRHGRKANVMTISWTIVVDFTPRFAITTGAWNYSCEPRQKTRECVITIPGVDMRDTVVGVWLGGVECGVVEIIRSHDIVVLDGVAAHHASSR
jgi:flavin reductase (DIM6/NTAB) family NADH-FMN oxidoreductase RutF